MARVLRPGGLIVGSDGLDTPDRRRVHHDDIFVPVDPDALPRPAARGRVRRGPGRGAGRPAPVHRHDLSNQFSLTKAKGARLAIHGGPGTLVNRGG